METLLTAEGIAFIVSLFVSALLFSLFGRIDFLRKNMIGSTIFTMVGLAVGCLSVLPFFWYEYDFIVNISVWKLLVPFVGAAIIVGATIFDKDYIVLIAILLATIMGVAVLDIEVVFFVGAPKLINQVATIVVWWSFAVGYRALSGLNTIPQTEAITVGVGFLLLSWLGLAPLMLGVFSSSLIAVFLIAYFYSSENPVGVMVSPAIGFVLGWLGLIAYGEYLLPCFVIFVMYYIIEFIVCLLKKITFLPQYKNFESNSVTLYSFYKGLPVMVILKNVWMINSVLIVFGLFQINGVNSYSIPSFVALLVSWQLYKMYSWEDNAKDLNEENRDKFEQKNISKTSEKSDEVTDKDQ
ncbi:MAG: hypothetical protein E7020_03900 [Alphaproteobacteria bacterium]|nr:hypothetical protein [Alphaproteobacteria bacterium]